MVMVVMVRVLKKMTFIYQLQSCKLNHPEIGKWLDSDGLPGKLGSVDMIFQLSLWNRGSSNPKQELDDV